jgi:hypothetical protein
MQLTGSPIGDPAFSAASSVKSGSGDAPTAAAQAASSVTHPKVRKMRIMPLLSDPL